MARKKTITTNADLTLEQLSQAYLEHIEKDGKSVGTCFSYCMELKTAQSELGAQTRVADLTEDKITTYFESARVTKLRGGKKPKSQLSIDKTRRVLRLALAWAEQSGLIEKSPIAAKVSKDGAPPAPEKKTRRKATVIEATPIAEPAPAETAA